MSEEDFLTIYKQRYALFLNTCIKTITDNSNYKCEYLVKLKVDFDTDKSNEANFLVSKIMIENSILDIDVLIELSSEKLSSRLVRKTYSIILECDAQYDKNIKELFLKLNCPL